MAATAEAGIGLVYDADCGFCTRSARWLAAGRPWVPIPWQAVEDLEAVGLTEQLVTSSAFWVDDGRVTAQGADAIAAALRTHCGWRRLAGTVLTARAVRPIAARVYRWVARNRYSLPGGTDACRIPAP